MIEFYDYIRPTRLDAAGGVMLGIRLIKSAPSERSASEERTLQAVYGSTVDVQRIAKLRDRLGPVNLKADDGRFDAAWAGLHGQLAAWVRLDQTAAGRTAAELLTSLFPDGLVFLTRSYEDEWVESKRRLDRIDEESLEETLTSLVHPDLLAHVRDAHAALGEGLGVGEVPLAIPDGAALSEALRTLALDIAAYARVLAGSVDERDDASVQRFRVAMAPLDAFRTRAGARRSGGGAESDEPIVSGDLEPDPGEDDVDPADPVPAPADGPPLDGPMPGEPVPPVL